MSEDGSMSAHVELERRYRRLLVWFPGDYRRIHGDEIVGVVMAAAATTPPQCRPTLAQTVDLIRAGLRIRIRPGAALADRPGWRDALAAFSVAAPLLLFAAVGVSYWADQRWSAFPGGLRGSLLDLAIYGQALLVPVVLCGLRRLAILLVAAQLLFVIAIAVQGIQRVEAIGASPAEISSFRVSHVIATASCLAAICLVEIAALVASPGPRRGMALLTWRHWTLLALASVPAGLLSPTFFVYEQRFGSRQFDGLIIMSSAALVILLAATWLTSGAGKRLAVLFGVLSYPCLICTFNGSAIWSGQTIGLASAPAVLIGFLFTAVIYRSIRIRRAGDRRS